MTSRSLPPGLARLGALLGCALLAAAPWLACAQVLPPPPIGSDEPDRMPAEARLWVKSFRFEGNWVFSDAELAGVTQPFTGRELDAGELEEARRAVTLHYISRGYLSSGAVLPDQDPIDGVVVMKIVEGRLTEIHLEGNRWLSDRYLTGRLQRWSSPVLNLLELQDGLQQLRQNPNVDQINAELKPGPAPGTSELEVRVTDRQPFRVGLQADNQRPPSVGAEQVWLELADLNLTGHSDPLQIRYGIANATADGLEFSGLDNLEGSYWLPLNRFETTAGVYGSRLNTSIVEQPFGSLDIESLTTSYGFGLRQPVHQTSRQEIALSLSLDHRVNQTELLGERFNLSPGAINGETVVTVLRFSQDWVRRGPNHVVALRSTFNFGLDAWEATDNSVPGDPNAEFFSCQGQAQYIQRLFGTQNQLVLRAAGQWTGERLLALEQFSVGGYETVRGYLENQLVRDRALVTSVEFRLPLLFDKSGAGILFAAPFFDFGGAWNVGESRDPTTIYSTGVGLRAAPTQHFSAEVYWGYRLRDVDVPDDAGLQRYGVHFRLNVVAL